MDFSACRFSDSSTTIGGFASVILLSLASVTSYAAPMSYTETASFSVSGSRSFGDDGISFQNYNSPITVNGYDNSLGQLTGVSISFDATRQLSAQLDLRLRPGYTEADCMIGCSINEGRNPTGYVDALVGLALFDTPVSGAAHFSTLNTGLQECEFNNGSCTSEVFSQTIDYSGSVLDANDPLVLEHFLADSISLAALMEVEGSVFYNCFDFVYQNCQINMAAELTGEVSITYHYDSAEVIEPATLALMSLGLFGLGVNRRYR